MPSTEMDREDLKKKICQAQELRAGFSFCWWAKPLAEGQQAWEAPQGAAQESVELCSGHGLQLSTKSVARLRFCSRLWERGIPSSFPVQQQPNSCPPPSHLFSHRCFRLAAACPNQPEKGFALMCWAMGKLFPLPLRPSCYKRDCFGQTISIFEYFTPF